MKKMLFLFLLLIVNFELFAQPTTLKIENKTDSTQFLKKQIHQLNLKMDSTDKLVKELFSKQEYIIENYKIQNETILYVSTILAVLLTVVIVYFGWRAQKVENEYERAKNDRARINEQFDAFLLELNDKKSELNKIITDTNAIKIEIEGQKDNISKMMEEFILTYTKDYIEMNKNELFKNNESENKADENFSIDHINQINEQIELIEKLQHDSDPEIIYKKIDIYFNTKKFNKVIKLTEELFKKDNFKKNYYFNYAYALSEINEFDKSLKFYNEYLSIYPTSAAALNNVGVIYQNNKDIKKALEYFEKALNLIPNYLYFRNLFNNTNSNDEKLNLFKKYFEKFDSLDKDSVDKKRFHTQYIKFIEDNLMLNELFNYHKEEYEKNDVVSTFLNLIEASILSREESKYTELIQNTDSYNLNSAQKLILNLLKALNNCLKAENCENEFNNIELISQDKSAYLNNWRFNLIDAIVKSIPNNPSKERIEVILQKLKENNTKN